MTLNDLYSVSQKKSPMRLSDILSQTFRIFNQFFTHLLLY